MVHGWRYNQASTAGVVALPALCAWGWTGTQYRSGSACLADFGSGVTFYSYCNASDTPTSIAEVSWQDPGNTVPNGNTYRIYGHADSSTSHSNIISNNGC
jgi:hypothetical protein